jgi:hypothetical protein
MGLKKSEILFIIESLGYAKMYYNERSSKYEHPFGEQAVKGYKEGLKKEKLEQFNDIIKKLKTMLEK